MGPETFDWCLRSGRHSIGRLQTRWSEDLIRVTGTRWMEALGEAYVQEWLSSADLKITMMMMMVKCKKVI